MKNIKNTYYIGVLAVVLFFIIVQFCFRLFPSNNQNFLLYKKIKDREIKSIVIRKSIDFSNHGATYVVYDKDSLPTHTGWDEKINIGDSIIKPMGSLKVIIKKDSLNSCILDYEENGEEILSTNF